MPRTVRAVGPLLALVLALAGALLVVEAVGSLAGADHVLLDWRGLLDGAGSDSWSSATARLMCAALTAAGVLLVVLALRGSRADVDLRTGDPALAGTTSRRAVARLVTTAVHRAEGVSGPVDVTVRRDTVQVRVTPSALDAGHPGPLTERVHAAATAALATLPLEREPRVTVAERTPEPARTTRRTA